LAYRMVRYATIQKSRKQTGGGPARICSRSMPRGNVKGREQLHRWHRGRCARDAWLRLQTGPRQYGTKALSQLRSAAAPLRRAEGLDVSGARVSRRAEDAFRESWSAKAGFRDGKGAKVKGTRYRNPESRRMCEPLGREAGSVNAPPLQARSEARLLPHSRRTGGIVTSDEMAKISPVAIAATKNKWQPGQIDLPPLP